MSKLLLVDGSNILHRAYHALPPMKNSKGWHTNAVFGFLKMMKSVMEKEKPTHVAVCFDKGKKTFRHQKYEGYKAKRKPTDTELVSQFPLVEEVLPLLGYKCLDSDDYEADDIIGTLAKKGRDAGMQVIILSGDKDLLQLIDDNVSVLSLKTGISKTVLIDKAAFEETYNLEPQMMIDLKGLMGDKSDNIPGVSGVGEVTALKLLHQYGSLDGVYEHIDEMKASKLKDKLENEKEKAYFSYWLATIVQDMPLDFEIDDLRPAPIKVNALRDMYKTLEFRIFLKHLDEFTEKEENSLFCLEDEPDITTNIEYKLIEDSKAFLLKHKTEKLTLLYALDSFFCGASNGDVVIIPGNSDFVKELLGNSSLEFISHNIKEIYHFAFKNNFEIKANLDDLEIMAYIVDVGLASFRLDFLFSHFDNIKLSDKESNESLCSKTIASFTLYETLDDKLSQGKMKDLYLNFDLPLAEILADMEEEGIRVDRNVLLEMSKELTSTLDEVTARIFELAGEEFNLNSSKQVGNILFEKLGLPPSKKTKTGYSTDNKVLEELAVHHPIVPDILQYRQLTKLKSTYTDALEKLINPKTGHIHTRFHQTITATGRLSSSDPNLQNIPIRMELGRMVRKAFSASDENHLLVAADYSQIELRMLAHYANDEALTSAFLHDADIHRRTASEIFGVPFEKVDSDLRRKAKAVNFGIIYGISGYGLGQGLGISPKEAKEYINTYFQRYPNVDAFLKSQIQKAKDRGFVETLWGRRRYLPDINSRNYNVRTFTERIAMNTPLQGSAADIMKGVMIKLYRALKDQGYKAKIILQVHDELILNCPKDEIEAVSALMKDVMENTFRLNVPLVVDLKIGSNWYDMKKVEE